MRGGRGEGDSGGVRGGRGRVVVEVGGEGGGEGGLGEGGSGGVRGGRW